MNMYTNKLTLVQSEKIYDYLKLKKADFDTIQYAKWRAKTPNYQAIYYNSGKFLVQGKDVSEIAQFADKILGIKSEYIPQSEGKVVSLTNEIETSPYDVYIGTDESGKGDFFGPLVVAAVQVNDKNKSFFVDLGIKDSKKLTDEKIKKLAANIRNNSVHSAVVIMPAKYNELYAKFNNLNKLLAWGHARAIENILEKSPCEYALSDKFGDEKLIQNALMKNGQKIKLDQRVRGESDIAVAAASIIARAEYVKRMDELSTKYKMDLPKGASCKVLEQGKIFIQKYHQSELKNIAKMHFKTANEIVNNC